MLPLNLLKKIWELKSNDIAEEGFESGKEAQKVQDLPWNSGFDQEIQAEYLQEML